MHDAAETPVRRRGAHSVKRELACDDMHMFLCGTDPVLELLWKNLADELYGALPISRRPRGRAK